MSDQEDLNAYYASQAAYGSAKHHNLLGEQGYALDPELSSSRYKTYYKNDNALVAYKGTNPLNRDDLDADVAIALGIHRNHRQFKEASDIASRAKGKYKNITTTGHSLGGTKAIESANDVGGRAIVFNPGTGLWNLKTGDHKVYHNTDDFISQRVEGSNVKKIKGRT